MSKKKKPRKETRREFKQKAVDYKGGCCEACGYNKCLAALTFHHKNPLEKDFGVSAVPNTMSWTKVKRELDKCFLLCVRCHTEVHNGLLDGYMDLENLVK